MGGVEGRTRDDADWCCSDLRCLVNSEGEELKGNIVAYEMLTCKQSFLLSPNLFPYLPPDLAEVTDLYLEKQTLSLSCKSPCQALKNCVSRLNEW